MHRNTRLKDLPRRPLNRILTFCFIYFIVLAAWRYHVVNRAIERGQVKADRGLVILVIILVVLISIGMILFML